MRQCILTSTVLDTGTEMAIVNYHKDGRMLHVLTQEIATSVVNQVNNDNHDK